MTTVVEYPLSVAGLYQYHDVIGLFVGRRSGIQRPGCGGARPRWFAARCQSRQSQPA